MKAKNLYIGKPDKIKDIDTSLKKYEVEEVNVFFEYIDGDEVNNKKHHGGKNRVLHQFPIENYSIFETYFSKINFKKGVLGENISSTNMNENSVCVGDVYQIGAVECIVTEPRKPCWTVDYVLDQRGFARFMQENCLTGWFYRILKEGKIEKGDCIRLISREFSDLTISSCIEALLIEPNSEVLKAMINNPVLSVNWKEPAKRVLQSGQIEDDYFRLKS